MTNDMETKINFSYAFNSLKFILSKHFKMWIRKQVKETTVTSLVIDCQPIFSSVHLDFKVSTCNTLITINPKRLVIRAV